MGRAIVSYIFSALSGICLITGATLLNGGHDG